MPLPLFCGWVFTLAWVCAISAYLWSHEQNFDKLGTLPPDAFGNFLAGACAPLAFLWLVVATLLQRKELEQNREALMLQASELKNSVEQLQHHTELMREEQIARTRDIREANFEHDLVGWALDCAKFARLTGGGDYHVRWDPNQLFSQRSALIDNAPSIEHFSNPKDLEKCFQEIESAFTGLIRIATTGGIRSAKSQVTFDEFLEEMQKLAIKSTAIRVSTAEFTTSKAAALLAKIHFNHIQIALAEALRCLQSNSDIRTIWKGP